MKFPRLMELLRRVVKSAWLKETLLALPRIALLVPKLMTDERVPRRTKLALAESFLRITSTVLRGGHAGSSVL